MATTFANASFAPPLPYNPAVAAAHGSHAAPTGTFAPGTKVQVGGHRVVVEKYLSEGGFAHVYLVRLPKPINGDDSAVLKRVAVPDKEALTSMRTEVETMKKLSGHRHIVTYIDSHASQLKGGGYEVFLLMEYCNGGGLIDFMNTRLQNRLTEPEVLQIFDDVAQGVACMHYLKPPLLHRDLKVENVLIRSTGSNRRYKLCDFGSTAPPRPAATTAMEGRLIEDDVQKNTTLQYRSPEMIDVYRRQPIDEKSDIWALGVLLYKLCYYKTPFEEQGQMAILNASFKFPGYPSFSDRLKKFIASMLQERPRDRPNIYQVVKETAQMRGHDVPIKDIYAGRTQSEARRNQHLPDPAAQVKSPPVVAGAFHAAPVKDELKVPEITPMRRGRPVKAEGDSRTPKHSRSPLRDALDDPFKILDKGKLTGDPTLDDVSTRFPALDDFSLLQDSGNRFAFDQSSASVGKSSNDITQRVTNALADDAFAVPKPTLNTSTVTPQPMVKGAKGIDAVARARIPPEVPSEKPKMVSIGTMTSPVESPQPASKPFASRGVWRVPTSNTDDRTNTASAGSPAPTSELTVPKRPGFPEQRSKSQIALGDLALDQGTTSESSHRSSFMSGLEGSVHRSKSASSKSRPSSFQGPSKQGLFRRLSKERSHESQSQAEATEPLTATLTGNSDGVEEATKIDSNVDYLKKVEEEETSKRKEKRLSGGSKHLKRASIPSVSLSGTKNLLAGRFGEAFRRFETNNEETDTLEPLESPIREGNVLTPIAGSEATDDRSDDGNALVESEEIPPEMRRELERRRLSEEERRVADAAAAYKQRLAGGGAAGPNRKAISIQSKVKSLLDESGRASPSPTKTASGYGKYTDGAISPLPDEGRSASLLPPRTSSRPINAQPAPMPAPHNPLTAQMTSPASISVPGNDRTRQIGTAPAPQSIRHPGPPKPKPQGLRTGDRPPPQQPALKPVGLSSRMNLQTRNPYQSTALAERAQKTDSDLGTATGTQGANFDPLPSDGDDKDWQANFSKRYPDLSGLEMVETEVVGENGVVPKTRTGAASAVGMGREARVRDV